MGEAHADLKREGFGWSAGREGETGKSERERKVGSTTV